MLDDLHQVGLSETFLGISLRAVAKYEVKVETGHVDSTSFHVDGEYTNQEEGSIEITHGYSRDHRPDLKGVDTGYVVRFVSEKLVRKE